MSKTTQKQKNMTEQSSEEDVFSEYLKSKDLHEGVSLENATVTVEKRFFPSKVKTSILSRRMDNYGILSKLRNKGNSIPDVSEKDIQHTIEIAEEENDKNIDSLLDYKKIKSFDDVDTSVVVHKESGKPVVGRLEYVVKVEFNDKLGQVQPIEKKFKDKDEATEFADRLKNSSEDFEVIYDDDELNIKAYHGSIMDSLKETIKENANLSMILAFSYSYWAVIAPIVSLSFSTSMIMIISLFAITHMGAMTKKKHESYGDSFLVKNKKQGISVEKPDSIEVEKEVWVDAKMEDDSVVLTSDELDTKWVFDVNDGVMSEKAIDFFDKDGKEALFDGKTRMVAKRESSDGIEDVNGKWYLESSY